MTLRRVPVGGWRRCVHAEAAFESPGEFAAAKLLDSARAVEWWARNDPVILRIPTPAGYFVPDFVYRHVASNGSPCFGILEIKGSVFWDGDGSDARVKADAACRWAKAVHEAQCGVTWGFAVVLEQDVKDATSFEAMLAASLQRFPAGVATIV
jgi:hypothetical protein